MWPETEITELSGTEVAFFTNRISILKQGAMLFPELNSIHVLCQFE